jgi:regulator of protease activity HflC (stomatin/prohibitin superfamily)
MLSHEDKAVSGSAPSGLAQVKGLMLAAVVLCLLLAAPTAWLRGSGVVAIPLAAILLNLAALLGTWMVARARVRTPGERAVGRAARLPQVIVVPLVALPAVALAWHCRPTAASLPASNAVAGAAIAVAFLLLIAERILAATSAEEVPEAAALKSLAFLATGVTFASGLLQLLARAGVPFCLRAEWVLALLVAAAGIELSLLALARVFLPPPAPELARGACASLVARVVSLGPALRGGVGAPLRQHLGIDFSRSWALTYVRAASLPMLGFFLLLAWGLSGVVLVGVDARAIYERFGAPIRVLQPGLHLGLPWPLGTTRAVEFGRIHEIGLIEGAKETIQRAGAEDPAPASADRLWEQAHPAEVALIIASTANGRQSFQSISADLRILYRVGLTDKDALHAAYASFDPEQFVRAASGRVVARYFADRTLDDVLGNDRRAMADALRNCLQTALDQAATGLQAVAVVIEAIHPPAGAADAYHDVRAAEISARASVAVEQGAAVTIHSQSVQYAFSQTANAEATGAETVSKARIVALRFAADQEAAAAGRRSFLLERYFGALSTALGHAPKTIIDHRLNWPEAPVLDLRPFAAAAAGTGGKEE